MGRELQTPYKSDVPEHNVTTLPLKIEHRQTDTASYNIQRAKNMLCCKKGKARLYRVSKERIFVEYYSNLLFRYSDMDICMSDQTLKGTFWSRVHPNLEQLKLECHL